MTHDPLTCRNPEGVSRGAGRGGHRHHLAGPRAKAVPLNAPVKLVIGFPPGGALDALCARRCGAAAAGHGVAVIVENKPGASTRIAIETVKRASPDGKTILLASSAPFVLFPMTYKRLSYDLDRDFIPVALLADVPTVVSCGVAQPYRTLPQYVAWVRQHPDQGGFGLTSLGGALHFAVLGMSKAIGVPLNAVAYKGGAPLATDIIRVRAHRHGRDGEPAGAASIRPDSHPGCVGSAAQPRAAGRPHAQGVRHRCVRSRQCLVQRLRARPARRPMWWRISSAL